MIGGTRIGLAFAVFVVTLLGMGAVVLAWEGIRGVIRQVRVRAQLERIERGMGLGIPEGEAASLLRRDEEKLPWLEPVLLWLPHRRDVQHLMEQADVRWGVGPFLLASAGIAMAMWVFTFLVLGSLVWALGGALVGATLPWLYLRRKRRKRFDAFEERFPEAIDLLGRSIRAGHALTTGLQVIAEETAEPVSGEFRQVFEEQKFGLPLRESLMGLADRVDLVDVRMFVTAVLIQRESGGNLAENLDNLSSIIRERFKFRRTLRTETAQGRMTGYVLALAPLAALLGMYMLNPEYERLLFTEPLGRMMLLGAAGMQTVGFLVIRRIVQIEF
ncbi:MAG TPA: type II secretion system F family protein [Gemmatimonadota bacterium]|nr:type II secretion system F family protein [Gemmatimonadota bacterium]